MMARAESRALHDTLILFGYLFYGWANPKFIFLMAATTATTATTVVGGI